MTKFFQKFRAIIFIVAFALFLVAEAGINCKAADSFNKEKS